MHNIYYQGYVEGVAINAAHATRDKDDWETVGFVRWSVLHEISAWLRTKPADKHRIVSGEGLEFEWSATGANVYVVSPSKAFAHREVLDTWDQEFLKWIAARRKKQGDLRPRPFGRIPNMPRAPDDCLPWKVEYEAVRALWKKLDTVGESVESLFQNKPPATLMSSRELRTLRKRLARLLRNTRQELADIDPVDVCIKLVASCDRILNARFDMRPLTRK